ncbi:hypothetical protein SAMN04489716_1483 [Actinoplanes derwentensis]|uniref:Uncharacterized protein n=1 Tax=Actinoplanes derwentensis TaxID=113562 RepID=A0A1H1UMK3_9ACTN|nr:hypothetical protein Ade03nite_70300 [Actinoplanes derwentensis]SDS73550.1 hypothetical protein SAMN04489716_1483 [Actinoplanes derwentensis]
MPVKSASLASADSAVVTSSTDTRMPSKPSGQGVLVGHPGAMPRTAFPQGPGVSGREGVGLTGGHPMVIGPGEWSPGPITSGERGQTVRVQELMVPVSEE